MADALRGMFGLLLVAGVARGGEDATLVLATGGTSEYVICVPSDPSPVERTAAEELQQHLAAVTGVTLPIRGEDAVPLTSPQIVVGQGQRLAELAPEVAPEQLGVDGIVVQTRGPHLLLVGRPPRGTLYAVSTFLQDVVGCRWWTSTESRLPERPELRIEPLAIEYSPPLHSRAAFYRDAFDPVFSARMKLNGHHHRIPAEYGGHRAFCGFVHTFYPLVPPEKYFELHPEWYSQIGGERRFERAQLCLTNQAMREQLVQNALERLRRQPDAQFLSVSQNDWYGRCECAACLAVEEREGSPAGPLLHFVNAVAEQIEREFPEVLVETLAYQYTRRPPRHVRPRENVVIRLCSIECSFVQTLADGPQNREFREDIEGWSRIAPRLFVWDYVTNFSSYILPHPNLRVLGPNIRFFAANQVIGLFEQGDAGSSIGDFVRLRAWLLARLMWQPELDEQALIDEFLAGYYGAAGPHLRAYLERIHDAAEASGVYLRCFMNDTSSWLELEDLNAATEFFARAEEAVADDPELARRVRRERMPLDHVWLNRYHTLRLAARLQGLPFRGPEDPQAAAEEFIALAHEFRVGTHREHQTFDDYEPALRRRFRAAAPPPALCRDLPPERWIDFPDHLLNRSRPGEWTFEVEDPQASDGHALRMPGDHHEWALQSRFTRDLAAGSPWRCYVVARCEATAESGLAMTMGIYDARERRSVVHRRIEVEEAAGSEYRVFDLGSHVLREDMYLWVAPPRRPGEVESVYVDRVFLVR